MTADKEIGLFEQGELHQRWLMLSLLDNELELCTCEEPLQHLKQRITSIRIKGEK